jgi:methionyl-tRNA formyltransferase
MNIVFFGTDPFAAQILDFLLKKGYNIVAVVTRIDKPKGRSGTPTPPPVKEFLETVHFQRPILQPLKASAPEFVEHLQTLHPDLFLVVSYGQILKQNLLDLPKFGAINVHPSILPKYRGPSPVQSAVLAGDEVVGVTIMKMVLALDAGDIIRVKTMPLSSEMTFGEAEQALLELAKEPLALTLDDFAKHGAVVSLPQAENEATFTKKIEPEESFISWDQNAHDIHNFIRGMSPKPGARTFVDFGKGKKLIKIFRAKPVDVPPATPGSTISFNSKEGWIISCKKGAIQILEAQLEGGKKMSAREFVCGFPLPLSSI